jgi:uncharacterized protein (TIGR02996 family)
MSLTERGLLQAIEEDIDDVVVRLAYADYLEEQGDPRGEFIRLQVARFREGSHDPGPRERELLERYSADWTQEAQPFDAVTVRLEFERGFIGWVFIEDGGDEDLAVVQRLPLLRSVLLERCMVTPTGLRAVVGLKHLRQFAFDGGMSIEEAELKVLKALPCGTRVCCIDNIPDEEEWPAFHRSRLAKFNKLPPEERRLAARRFVTALTGGRWPVTEVRLGNEFLDDAELGFLREVPELERIELEEPSGLTPVGLKHLAAIPNLKAVSLWDAGLETIRPLTQCPALEVLRVYERGGCIPDDGTKRLDRLTNLQVLELRSVELGDATIRRLRPLRNLRELTLEVGPLADEECLKAISGLTELESLSINEAGGREQRYGPSDVVLRHFAGLRKLQTLKLHLGAGDGEGLRHLAGLSGLRYLQLSGAAVTDAGIRHLATLRDLRTFIAAPSSISVTGARALAQHLPGVTILMAEQVVKSPRSSIPFRRFRHIEWASVLVPEDWSRLPDGSGVNEDGWEPITGVVPQVVGSAGIQFYSWEEQTALTAEESMQRFVGVSSDPSVVRVQERGLVTWPGWETASCVWRNSYSRTLLCAAVHGRRSVVLQCNAPPSRFEEFRPLFLFVARSVRLDDGGGDERVEVPVAELATFAP